MAKSNIPGINTVQKTDLPVLKPYFSRGFIGSDPVGFARWIASIHPGAILLLLAIIFLWPMSALASTGYTYGQAVQALFKWMPFLLTSGFLFNVIISVLTMLIGTVAGVMLGLAQISPLAIVRTPAKIMTQLFRNSPWLVVLFIVLLAFPFEIVIGGYIISIPDWMKAVFGLSLPIMANVSEVVRGGVQSVASGQWEAAESLAYTRRQTLWQVILPQCFKRMIPPWMNWYAILTMATPMCTLLGVEEMITLSRQAIEAENNKPELLVPFYSFALLVFFAYCYPIARITIALERRYAVKL
ncbi:MAG: amino acid ABC transporter permease [Pseudomonadota bacterium]